MSDSYTPIIGMEIHVELKTKSKMFCGCKNDPFHAEKPNIYTCPVCLGMPGALPVPNKKAIESTILLGLALNCTINNVSKFDRKNYFYPDLAKGYQISQYDQPLCINGIVKTEEGDVRIRRVHLEEDTGKLQHTTIDGKNVSLVDFNRCGVPLVEIVTEPDIHSGEHAKSFLKKLHQIVTDLGISDAEMEKGSMRLEPNISVKIHDSRFTKQEKEVIEEKDLPTYKVEVKNINSFNFVKKAIEYEIPRHIEILSKGTNPKQETRGWNEDKGVTVSQRSKEEAADYRYFPEPDIPPLRFTQEYLNTLKKSLPKTHEDKAVDSQRQYILNTAQSISMLTSLATTTLFQGTAALLDKNPIPNVSYGTISNWIGNKVPDPTKTTPQEEFKKINVAFTVVDLPEEEITNAIKKVLADNPKAVADYKSGKETVIMFLFGQTMKALQGKGDKGKIQELLKKLLQA